jgi:uncharacterized protein DUF222
MEPNIHSTEHPTRPSAGHPAGHPAGPPDDLAALVAAVDGLAAQDLTGLPDAVRAERVLVLRRLLDRLKATGWPSWPPWTPVGRPAPKPAWRRTRPPAGCGPGWGWAPGRPPHDPHRPGPVPRPLAQTAQALTDGELSVAHASVLAHGTHDLPTQVTVEAEPVLVEAARRLDPARLRRVIGHLRLVADPRARPPGRTPPPAAAGAVADPDPGRPGRPGRAAGP